MRPFYNNMLFLSVVLACDLLLTSASTSSSSSAFFYPVMEVVDGDDESSSSAESSSWNPCALDTAWSGRRVRSALVTWLRRLAELRGEQRRNVLHLPVGRAGRENRTVLVLQFFAQVKQPYYTVLLPFYSIIINFDG